MYAAAEPTVMRTIDGNVKLQYRSLVDAKTMRIENSPLMQFAPIKA